MSRRNLSSISLKSLSRSKRNASSISVNDIGPPQHPKLVTPSPLPTLQKPSPTNNPRDPYGRISPKSLDAGGGNLAGLAAASAVSPPATTYPELPADTKPAPRTPRWKERAREQSGNVYVPRFGESNHISRVADPHYDPINAPYCVPRRSKPPRRTYSDSTRTGPNAVPNPLGSWPVTPTDLAYPDSVGTPAVTRSPTSNVIAPSGAPKQRMHDELAEGTLTRNRSVNTSPDLAGSMPATRSSNPGLITPFTDPTQRMQEELSKSTFTGNRSKSTFPDAAAYLPTLPERSQARVTRKHSHPKLTARTSNTTPGDAPPLPTPPPKWAQDENFNKTLSPSRSSNTSPDVPVTPSSRAELTGDRSANISADPTSTPTARRQRSRANLTGDGSASAFPDPAASPSARRQRSRAKITDNPSDTFSDAATRTLAYRQRSLAYLTDDHSGSTPPDVFVTTPPQNRKAKVVEQSVDRIGSQPRLNNPDGDGGSELRVVEGGLLQRRANAPPINPIIPEKNAARFVRKPVAKTKAVTIVGMVGPHDRVEHTPEFPLAWQKKHDKAICILDTRNFSPEMMINKLRGTYPELQDSFLSPAMIDTRLRQLDNNIECDYFRVGLKILAEGMGSKAVGKSRSMARLAQ